MYNYFINPLVYLFEKFEDVTGVPFLEFSTEKPDNTLHTQKYMKQYNDLTNKGTFYKYLYVPDLAFDFRFHQHIAKIQYTERKTGWVTPIFSTGVKNQHTNVLSHVYSHWESFESKSNQIRFRRSLIPVNLVFISNDINFLYTYLGKLNFWFDRIVGLEYKQDVLIHSAPQNIELSCDIMNILPKDLSKLDTSRKGSLVTAAYTFDINYTEFDSPVELNLLETIGIQIRSLGGLDNLVITHQ